MSQVLWSSVSNNEFLCSYNYNELKKKFNKNFTESIDIDLDNDSNESNHTEVDDNKLILEKINNYIDQIKDNKLSFISKNVLELLKEQESICTYLCKYVLQNNYLNYDFFTNSLILLKELSAYLRNKINQKKFTHDLKKIKLTNSIPRSSYKFCHFKDSCMYNYDKDKNGCYADHYVHNLAEADIEALIEYIKNNFKDNNIINHNKEIIKCINTLCFVIKHMASELNSLCIYCEPDEYNNFHFNKIVKKNKNKKKKKKSSKKSSKKNSKKSSKKKQEKQEKHVSTDN